MIRIEGGERSPGKKLLFAILVAVLLAIPLFTVWLLIYDRQSQSDTARESIAEGWGGPQTIAGPLLVIPYLGATSETVEEAGKQVTRTRQIWQELTLAPQAAEITTSLRPEARKRSIYEVVVYEALAAGKARFAIPDDLNRLGIPMESLAFDRAEIRFGLSDARGLFGAPPRVTLAGKTLSLHPGHGTSATSNAGFFAWIDVSALPGAPITVAFDYRFRGNGSLTLHPQAGDTYWSIKSAWPHPSFQGGFLPVTRSVDTKGFTAEYRIGNLALGTSLISSGEPVGDSTPSRSSNTYAPPTGAYEARVDLVQPVDLYAQVSRAAKYGFLFIGFTFLAFLMFDVIGGVKVSTVEYLLIGAALVLFFVLLLAFAEVIGFTAAYLLASAAIIGLITTYSAAVLKSWPRASFVAGLLIALYAVLYVLLSLEAYSLLIGSVMLFVALASVMYVTRRLDWSGRQVVETAGD